MKLTPEQQKLKDFIEDNIPFYPLKKAGFWPAGTRKNHYDTIAARVCQFFGYASIYEYGRELRSMEQVSDNVVVGEFADTVSPSGELRRGGGFHLSLA